MPIPHSCDIFWNKLQDIENVVGAETSTYLALREKVNQVYAKFASKYDCGILKKCDYDELVKAENLLFYIELIMESNPHASSPVGTLNGYCDQAIFQCVVDTINNLDVVTSCETEEDESLILQRCQQITKTPIPGARVSATANETTLLVNISADGSTLCSGDPVDPSDVTANVAYFFEFFEGNSPSPGAQAKFSMAIYPGSDASLQASWTYIGGTESEANWIADMLPRITGTGHDFSFNYANAAHFQEGMTVTMYINEVGCGTSTEDVSSATYTQPNTPIAAIVVTNPTQQPLERNISGTTSDDNGCPTPGGTYAWTVLNSSQAVIHNSIAASFDFTFPAVGQYTINLTFTTACGVDVASTVVDITQGTPFVLLNSTDAGTINRTLMTNLFNTTPGLLYNSVLYETETELADAAVADNPGSSYDSANVQLTFSSGTPPVSIDVSVEIPETGFTSDWNNNNGLLGLLNAVVIRVDAKRYLSDTVNIVQTDISSTEMQLFLKEKDVDGNVIRTINGPRFNIRSNGTQTIVDGFNYSDFNDALDAAQGGLSFNQLDQSVFESAFTPDAQGGTTRPTVRVKKMATDNLGDNVDTALKGFKLDGTVSGSGTNYLQILGFFTQSDTPDNTLMTMGAYWDVRAIKTTYKGVDSVNVVTNEEVGIGIMQIKESTARINASSGGPNSVGAIPRAVGDGIHYSSNPPATLNNDGNDWHDIENIQWDYDGNTVTTLNINHIFPNGNSLIEMAGNRESDKNDFIAGTGLRFKAILYATFPTIVANEMTALTLYPRHTPEPDPATHNYLVLRYSPLAENENSSFTTNITAETATLVRTSTSLTPAGFLAIPSIYPGERYLFTQNRDIVGEGVNVDIESEVMITRTG